MPGATITWGLPYQLLSEPPNGPVLGQSLAEAVDSKLTIINNKAIRGARLIGRARRTSASAGSTGLNVGVLRCNAPIVTGELILVEMMCHPTSTVTTDNIEVGFKFTTAGGTATASDLLLPGSRTFGLFGQIRSFWVPWTSTATGTLSVASFVRRDTGSGSCTLYADTTERFTDMFIWAIESPPAMSGTDL